MISSVRRCTLGGIIAGLNGDAFIALVPKSVNFDRRRGGEVATKYRSGTALITMSRGHNHVPHGVLDAGGWILSHSPKNNGGTRSAAHKRCGGVVPVLLLCCRSSSHQASWQAVRYSVGI